MGHLKCCGGLRRQYSILILSVMSPANVVTSIVLQIVLLGPHTKSTLPHCPYECYDFCGDLTWVSYLLFSFSSIILKPVSQAKPLGDSDQIGLSLDWRPYAHITGIASKCDQVNGSWTIYVQPFVSSSIKSEPGAAGPPRPSATYICQHPSLGAKSTTKQRPVPYGENRFVAVHGFITDVIFNTDYEDEDQHVVALTVIVKHVEFLGVESTNTSSASPSGSAVANTLDCMSFFFFVLFDYFKLSCI